MNKKEKTVVESSPKPIYSPKVASVTIKLKNPRIIGMDNRLKHIYSIKN